jgi:hypothetical protein
LTFAATAVPILLSVDRGEELIDGGIYATRPHLGLIEQPLAQGVDGDQHAATRSEVGKLWQELA